jgi:hypothetical protein
MTAELLTAARGFTRITRRKSLPALLLLAAGVFIAYSLTPLLNSEAAIADATASKELAEVRAKLLDSVKLSGEPAGTVAQVSLTPLVKVLVPIRAWKSENGVSFETGTTTRSIRYDQFVLLLGTLGVLFFTVQTLLPSTPLIVSDASPVARASRGKSTPKTATALFERDVRAAERRAQVLFNRSTLLLGGGIIMAFIGVTIFYLSLPESANERSLSSYALQAIRPTGVLIFVEAIAWFLLRQYRALIEDYKWFHRLYMKRANYLAAMRILEKSAVRPEDLYIVASLAGENLSDRMKKDETTESLQRLQMSDDNPVSEILKVIGAIYSDKGKLIATPVPKSDAQATGA